MERNDLEAAFVELLYQIEDNKPDDRSETDRLFTIIKTDAQKLYALYLYTKNLGQPA